MPAVQAGLDESLGGFKMAIGLSLGISVGIMACDSIIERIFSKPEPKQPEKVTPTVDPILTEFSSLVEIGK